MNIVKDWIMKNPTIITKELREKIAKEFNRPLAEPHNANSQL